MVVLGYLNNRQRRFSNYVTRRIISILGLTSVKVWQYISTSLNPADVASRFHTATSLFESSWLSGPDFLHSSGGLREQGQAVITDLPEERVVTVLCTKTEANSCILSILDRTNNLSKALEIVKIVISFVYRIQDSSSQRCGISIAPRDMDINRSISLQVLTKCTQQFCFPELYRSLELSDGAQSTELNKYASLNPFLESGVIKVGGRLKGASLLPVQKHPVLLPTSHSFTKMIVLAYHESTNHQGRHLTSGALRTAGYHIFKGTKTVKKIIENCVQCVKLRGVPVEQLMADLPPARIEDIAPFHNTGVDVFGHFLITDGKTTRRTMGSKKVWVVLFTCMGSRAVHVDLLIGLDSSSFKNALRRFVALRGSCKHFYSDRGTNFVGANSQEASVDLKEMTRDLKNCEWHFNTPRASHHGGAWERKIGAIRRVLEGSMLNLRGRLLSRDEFYTLLLEAMAIVNNTPLWNVSTDPKDPAPITPAMILTMRDVPNPPSIHDFTPRDVSAYSTRRWRRVQYIAECFWSQWREYYLSSLQERRKWFKTKRNLQVDDVVLLRDKSVKRNLWPTGIISSVNKKDGYVRSVTVDVSLPKGNDTVRKSYNRPISEVILLIPSCN